MEAIICKQFFKNQKIAQEIKTRNILTTLETNKCEPYELVSYPYFSIIEKIANKYLLNVNIFISIFLIYEKQRCCINKKLSINEVYIEFQTQIIELYKDLKSKANLQKVMKVFHKIIYLNLELFDNIPKYEINISLSRIFESIEKNNLVLLIQRQKYTENCNICFNVNRIFTLLCCKQVICEACFNHQPLSFCPYCKLDFTKKFNIHSIKK